MLLLMGPGWVPEQACRDVSCRVTALIYIAVSGVLACGTVVRRIKFGVPRREECYFDAGQGAHTAALWDVSGGIVLACGGREGVPRGDEWMVLGEVCSRRVAFEFDPGSVWARSLAREGMPRLARTASPSALPLSSTLGSVGPVCS